jgi:hypothetical protein
MIKIKIADAGKDIDYLESAVPVLPRIGDKIGFFTVNKFGNNVWQIATVEYLVYEFDEDNQFEMVEISVKTDE